MGLTTLDYIVLAGYFVLMTLIGLWSMFFVKKQEDYFLGSRSFGKLFQMFAAFGAGTNASDPIVTAKTTFTNGLSGVWSGLLWLFVTPFYWICGVWYRRMRCLTLGDWFEERYQSKAIAFAYMIFGAVFYMVYLGVGMTAIGKMGAPLVGADSIVLFGHSIQFDQFIIILTALCVLFYGVLGGLRAAYWTDLIQGIFIIILSVILIPVGLSALVKDENAIASADANASAVVQQESETDSNQGTLPPNDIEPSLTLTPSVETMKSGFTILHKRVPAEYFEILSSPKGGEFPFHYIVAITLLNLLGIVCQPHFIATGGGSAKSEFSARFGLVAGNILKRFCTIGWAFTALVALAYLAGNVELAEDPDKVWGVATRELLGPLNAGLVGLMLACLLAALMSSASCYMLVVSGLVVRNGYAALINPNASEKTYVLAGRICGAIVILGATVVSLTQMNVFEQLKFAWEIPIVFAAPFWIGMYWRRANKYSAWGTIILTLVLFFIVPMNIAKFNKDLPTNPNYLSTNEFVVTTEKRPASPTDVERRNAARKLWENRKNALLTSMDEDLSEEELSKVIFRELGNEPNQISIGEQIVDEFKTGGKAIYWGKGVVPYDSEGAELIWNSSGKVIAKVIKDPQTSKEHKIFVEENDQIELFDASLLSVTSLGENRERVINRFKSIEELQEMGISLRGKGTFELDFLLYERLGVDLCSQSTGTLEAMRLPTRLFLPFVFLILFSFITPRGDEEKLDRYYVKMKTPVDPNPEIDEKEMQLSYENPHRFDDKRLFKFGGLEFNRPNWVDVIGFIISFILCIGIIWLIVIIANYQP